MLAGALTAVSSWRHWAACRPDISAPGCLLMTEETIGLPLWADAAHRDLWASALVGGSATLLSLAWFVASGWARGSVYRLAVAAFVGAQPLLVAVLVELELIAPGQLFAVAASGWLLWPAEVLVFPLLLGQGWLVEESPVRLARLLMLAWGATAFGPLHHFVDHVGSMLLVPVAAPSPPGLGYVTAGTQVVLGVAVVVVTLLLPRPKPTDGDELTGRDGFTLAA